MSKLKIRDVFRYARPYSAKNEEIDGYKNHFFSTNLKGGKLVLLDKGINQIARVNCNNEYRTPAILIRSSPHKIGSEDTPCRISLMLIMDIFDTTVIIKHQGKIRH